MFINYIVNICIFTSALYIQLDVYYILFEGVLRHFLTTTAVHPYTDLCSVVHRLPVYF